ncbi:MAG: tRNA (adenosine(37)-N6)-threonylcarbamoyltransferase complex ATPase subunit type 1 TsaE [Candidatus Omnitrophica bacterium]|nr:tRNA (adenosine(37)-N6)-threonylcarbamoyltransferase complex ATPase subunit type 1 TsaE [Candidatus Omnitrophota bacterium]
MTIISRSVKYTRSIGFKIARLALPGDIICLYGDLGSGKTVLTKGIAQCLGVNPDSVISPTFVILRVYDSEPQLHHFDFYRLIAQKDIALLGIEEYLYSNAISVIEWPDRLGRFLPKEFLKVELKIKNKNTRLLKFSGLGKYYKDRAKDIYENIGN